jgi:glycosyltransferase involved in cell wall biosynthesis
MPTFLTGGAERLVSDLVQRLDPSRFRAIVCVFENGLLGEELAQRGYTVHCLSTPAEARAAGGRLGGFVRRALALRRLIAMEKVSVVHTHFLGPALHAYLAGLPTRHWAWVHTEHVRPDHVGAYPRWLLRAARWIVPSSDLVTGVSNGVAAYFAEQGWAPHSRVRVIYNGVSVDLFAGHSDRLAIRRGIGLPSDAWVVGTVGNLRPQKNHELLLKALARLRRDVPEAWVVVVGGGDRRGELETLAADLGVKERVLFLGARTDVAQLFGMFDVYCLPSHFEGMPLSLLEAMAARKPIVATRVVGIEDLLVDGVTGLLSPPNDPEALAGNLLRLYRDRALAAKLVEAGWQHVDTEGRLETMVQRYEHLYEALRPRTTVGEGGRRPGP